MILRRLGNKSKIAKEIQKHFPPHKIYIEPFFGAGGMFFNKPKVKYNIVNDLDSDVFNLFQVVMNRKEELEKAFYIMPIHSDLLDYWKKNKETDPIKKALRFLFLSNFTYLGKMDTIQMKLRDDPKRMFYNYIDKTFELLINCKFSNFDFRKFFNSLAYIDIDYGHPSEERKHTFFYNDGPYLNTVDTYKDSDIWTEKDVVDLFDANQESGCRFAYSEFDHPFILNQVKERNLNVIVIGERQNLKNRRTEILITNYENSQLTIF
jgi:DNA adenine methylase